MPSIFEDIGRELSNVSRSFRRTVNDPAGLRSLAEQAGDKLRIGAAKQSGKRAQDLFEKISKSEKITEATRQELLFSLGKIETGAFQTFAEGQHQRFTPEFLSGGQTPITPFEGKFDALTSPELLGLPTTVAGIEQRLAQASGVTEEGTGIFSARKRSERVRERAKDQPGRRQFLLESPGVSAGPKSAAPTLTERL